MWVIVVNDNAEEHRDKYISELLGDNRFEEYLCMSVTRYSSTRYLGAAKVYKTEYNAKNLIKKFLNDANKISFKSKFHWINNKHLSCRKLSMEEWNRIVDNQIEKLENKFQRNKQKLQNKKILYK